MLGKTVVLLGKDKGEANEEGVFGRRSDVYVWFEVEVGGRVEDISCFTGSDQDRHKKEKETTNEYYVIHLAVQEASAPVILSEILILFIL